MATAPTLTPIAEKYQSGPTTWRLAVVPGTNALVQDTIERAAKAILPSAEGFKTRLGTWQSPPLIPSLPAMRPLSEVALRWLGKVLPASRYQQITAPGNTYGQWDRKQPWGAAAEFRTLSLGPVKVVVMSAHAWVSRPNGLQPEWRGADPKDLANDLMRELRARIMGPREDPMGYQFWSASDDGGVS